MRTSRSFPRRPRTRSECETLSRAQARLSGVAAAFGFSSYDEEEAAGPGRVPPLCWSYREGVPEKDPQGGGGDLNGGVRGRIHIMPGAHGGDVSRM
jgi:hypothetical protein